MLTVAFSVQVLVSAEEDAVALAIDPLPEAGSNVESVAAGAGGWLSKDAIVLIPTFNCRLLRLSCIDQE